MAAMSFCTSLCTFKKNLAEIINENQNGFMAKHHISSNVRLLLDLNDYLSYINSIALLVFLDIYKAFDFIEHPFIIQELLVLLISLPCSIRT